MGPPQEFYKAALIFLAYTPIEDMPLDQRYVLATDMALASATGENVFNFGEVLATPILATLKNTPNEWMHDLVICLNRGDIDGFNLLVSSTEAYFAQPVLAARHEEIKKKLVLLCLMNMVFERAPHDRVLAFGDIATRTRIPIDQVGKQGRTELFILD